MMQILTPRSLEEALELLAIELPPKVLAGGTDLLVLRKDNPDKFASFLALENVHELCGIHKEDNHIRIGSRATHSEIEHSGIVTKYAPVLAHAAAGIGSVQIRNRGTIGGNIIHASPAGDLIPALIALDAVAELHSLRSRREIPLREFFLGPGKSVCRGDELLVAAHFQLPDARERGTFLKIGPRKAVACSKVNVAVQALVHHKSIEWIRIALGAVAPTVIRAPRTESLLQGRLLSRELITEAREAVREEISPITDIRSTAEYRRQVAGVLLERALEPFLSK
ncbi:MAG: xanthine dehydrogenase family protein subunit M [bacterium]